MAETYREQWESAAAVLRAHAVKFDEMARSAPPRPVERANAMKVAVCEYLLQVNRDHEGPFIPPTAIDWLGNGIVGAILGSTHSDHPEEGA